jgi:peptidoglycan/xylan/chitin deacetylase (PgdA/CDA1 family)
VITVDDGYKDFVSVARPLLQAYHYPATLYVYTCFVNSKNGLTQDQLKQLQAQGFEIGSHTATHPKLTKDFSKLSADKKAKALNEELVASRQQLRTWSGGDVCTLAYPYGLWDQEVAKIATDAGFQLMFTVNPGTNDSVQPKESLNRIMILRGTRDKTFRAMLRDQPLEIIAWDPPLGQHVAGPVSEVRVTLSPATLGLIDPASLQAKLGSEKLTLDMHPSLGQVVIRFAKPWTHGTNLLVLTAKGRQGHNTFKNSWLMIVDPQKGK